MLNVLLLSASALLGGPTVTWETPTRYIAGAAFPVSIEIAAPEGGAEVNGWMLTSAAFTLNGKPLTERQGKETIALSAGTKLSLTFDLGADIKANKSFTGKGFKLGFAKEYNSASTEPIQVQVAQLAPSGLDFMEVPLESLNNYQVIMNTNQGEMVFEFWPETAPNHVRNFLDLCYTDFYEGVTFHRVIPGFMIQGGDPTGTGRGSGKRTLKAEFTTDPKYRHVPGVLSMARTTPDSASCQFFVMHKDSSHLDGQYSVFGKCIEGLDVVERIVMSPRDASDKPRSKQFIKSATVIVAPK
jgi:peptidyl-prolyl cis-trans isomerase B (cyclophilin B)